MDDITSWLFVPHKILPVVKIIGKVKEREYSLSDLLEGAEIFIELANEYEAKFLTFDDNGYQNIKEGEMAISFCMSFPNNQALDDYLDEVDEYLN